jgi:GNAT superfamily N-acetyltransferase
VQAVEMAAATMFDDNGLLDGVPDEPADFALLRDAVADARLWVAITDRSEIVGFALARWCGDDAHLQELDVLPEWGRQGIGRLLVAVVFAWAAGNERERVTLTTFTEVPWNAPFYERLGFVVLAPGDWTDALRETWDHERAMGLPMEQRVVMAGRATKTARGA